MFHLLFILLIRFEYGFCEEHWGYENGEHELDPKHWYVKYKTCIGKRQSPIDIDESDIILDPLLKPITYHRYSTPLLKVNLTNDGHTVRVDIPDNANLEISSQSFNTTYKLKQFHFHWAHNGNTGSEHAIFRKKFPLEMHLVHADERVSYDDALEEPYGLVVISVMFKLGIETSEEISKLVGHFRQIADPKIRNATTIHGLKVRDLLPRHVGNYFQYSGSLTTPPCNEAVKWVILTHTPQITEEQMHQFRILKHVVDSDGDEEELETNDRDLQGIKDRRVYLHYNFDDFNY